MGTRPDWFSDQRRSAWCLLSVVGALVFGGGQVVQSGVVVPVDPFHERVLDLGEGFERPLPVDDLGLEQPDDRLGQRVVIRIPTDPMDAKSPCRARDSVDFTELYSAGSIGGSNIRGQEGVVGRPSIWVREVAGRAPMRSPGHPGHQRAVARPDWGDVELTWTSAQMVLVLSAAGGNAEPFAGAWGMRPHPPSASSRPPTAAMTTTFREPTPAREGSDDHLSRNFHALNRIRSTYRRCVTLRTLSCS